MTKTTGQRIRELREERDISQQELADMLGINRVSVTQWEKGTTAPAFQRIKLLSDIFNVSTDYLLCISDVKQEIKENNESSNFIVDVDDFLNHARFRCDGVIYNLSDEDRQLFKNAIEMGLITAREKENKRKQQLKRKNKKK